MLLFFRFGFCPKLLDVPFDVMNVMANGIIENYHNRVVFALFLYTPIANYLHYLMKKFFVSRPSEITINFVIVIFCRLHVRIMLVTWLLFKNWIGSKSVCYLFARIGIKWTKIDFYVFTYGVSLNFLHSQGCLIVCKCLLCKSLYLAWAFWRRKKRNSSWTFTICDVIQPKSQNANNLNEN